MTYSKGLEGIIAGETAISLVEGDIGRLSYRGYAIEALVEQPYLAVMWLVLFGEWPSEQQVTRLDDYLSTHAPLTPREVKLLQNIDPTLHPMKMLQGMVPLLDIDTDAYFYDTSANTNSDTSHGLQLLARMPTLIASYHRLRHNHPLVTVDPDASYLGRFLSQLTGKNPEPRHEHLLTVVQILQMEHSFNAGTFAARVTASTLASVDAVFGAAIGTLSGVLHGGADEAALRYALSVGRPEQVPAALDKLLSDGGKLMGMGHREYRTVDPRATILKPMAADLCRGTTSDITYQTLAAIEADFGDRMTFKGKLVKANLEFYKGVVYEALGISVENFTAVFALSRGVGWLAHLLESRVDNRIIRPSANYVGAAPRQLDR
jgi:citrate synthase